jgi:hypothetical protein
MCKKCKDTQFVYNEKTGEMELCSCVTKKALKNISKKNK